MVISYQISGMTCSACTQIVHDSLTKVTGVKKADVDLTKAQANVAMEHSIPIETFREALAKTPYQISELASTATNNLHAIPSDEVSEMNKELVVAYISAVGGLEHERLHQFLHGGFQFNGIVAYNSAREYIQMIKEHASSPVAGIILKNDIKAIFADEDECCVIYDFVTRFPGLTVPFVEWIKIKDGKIASTRVKFNRYRMKLLIQEMNSVKKS